MAKRQQVTITITVSGDLDPTSVKAQAFSRLLASKPADGEEIPRDEIEQAASAVSGNLKWSTQHLVKSLGIHSLLEAALPSFEARRDGGFSVVVEAPGLGPEDGGVSLVDMPA
jgi:hypothetical protein